VLRNFTLSLVKSQVAPQNLAGEGMDGLETLVTATGRGWEGGGVLPRRRAQQAVRSLIHRGLACTGGAPPFPSFGDGTVALGQECCPAFLRGRRVCCEQPGDMTPKPGIVSSQPEHPGALPALNNRMHPVFKVGARLGAHVHDRAPPTAHSASLGHRTRSSFPATQSHFLFANALEL
jgi:hypothetical protein